MFTMASPSSSIRLVPDPLRLSVWQSISLISSRYSQSTCRDTLGLTLGDLPRAGIRRGLPQGTDRSWN